MNVEIGSWVEHWAERLQPSRMPFLGRQAPLISQGSLTPRQANAFILRPMRPLSEVLRCRQATLAILLGIVSMLGGGCAAPEPLQVKLEKADVLPLAIDSNFAFRKKTQFLNDPSTYIAGGPRNEAIEFERKYYMWPATTKLEKDALRGNYLSFFWWNHGSPADVTVRLEYRQANLGPFVMAREKSYSSVKGSIRSQFSIIGDDYLENGPVTTWRALLIVDGRIVGLTQSYLWK